MNAKVKASLSQTNFYTEVVAGNNRIIVDEPIEKGGQDKGFRPSEVLASSLATCTAITLKMYLDRKQWPVENIEVEVHLEGFPDEKRTVFTTNIHVKGDLDEKQIERLHKIAQACPVHKVLSHQIEIKTKVV